MLASASATCADVPSQIIVWDLKQMASHKVLTYHDNNVICLAYSRDDRFLLSLGETLTIVSTWFVNMLGDAYRPLSVLHVDDLLSTGSVIEI